MLAHLALIPIVEGQRRQSMNGPVQYRHVGCLPQADRSRRAILKFHLLCRIIRVQDGFDGLVFIGVPVGIDLEYCTLIIVLERQPVIGGVSIANPRRIETLRGQVKLGFGFVLVRRTAGGTEGGTVAALIAAISDV